MDDFEKSDPKSMNVFLEKLSQTKNKIITPKPYLSQ